MTTYITATDLSVEPPIRQMADTDRESLRFDAGETISEATATAWRLDTNVTDDSIIESCTADTDGCDVLVSGLTRGVSYELSVVFARSNGTEWTRTLVIMCVA